MTNNVAVAGTWIDENGFVAEDDRLRLTEDNGRWYWEGSQPVKAERYGLTGDLTAVRIVSAATAADQAMGLGVAWEFSTSEDECARVGMMIHEIA
ncbi:hypothetical protein ACELLULO517_07660 [Acidisoma cellulosilytica]|uniref:Uncharacterized protein n=1 Tax=Acidisoma cellulosilyticum TaxID=2802395 RepID=A0A963Z170_9PROT|nr:hypothetical protein [Acidisoma cellulosilyticum]MCB8880107.1 hypothetical protein [Acidisoma cellulosilyticum]